MLRRRKILVGLVSLVWLFSQGIFLVSAQSADCPQEGVKGVDFLFFQGPLVPCGRISSCTNANGIEQTEPCTLCHLILLFKNVFDLLFSLLITMTFVFLTIGGVLYIVSAGSGLKSTAKGIITKTLMGFAIFLLSWLMVNLVLNLLSAKKGGDGLIKENWYEFSCETTRGND